MSNFLNIGKWLYLNVGEEILALTPSRYKGVYHELL